MRGGRIRFRERVSGRKMGFIRLFSMNPLVFVLGLRLGMLRWCEYVFSLREW
jgi:hypothetical protein